MVIAFRLLGLAAAFALAPLAASAATFNPANNIAPGDTVDLLAEPYFFSAQYDIGEGSSSYAFTFVNTSNRSVALASLGLDVNQNTASFYRGVSLGFDDDVSFDFAQAVTDGQAFTTLVAAGESRTLTIDRGKVVDRGPRGGETELSFTIEAAVIPVPAAGVLLLSALGSVAALRRRKTA